MPYTNLNTDFDVMKEYLIQGAELDYQYGIPLLPPVNAIPTDTIDFSESLNRRLKDCRNLTVNFYTKDREFTRIWNNADKYLEHLKCFQYVISPDFSISVGKQGMPFALNLYNLYRNHALGWYLHRNGIKIIPSVNILSGAEYEWIYTGLPRRSTVACCTNGRVKSKAARLDFCQGFYEMCERLNPTRVIIVGYLPDELNTDVEIINLKSRNQKYNEIKSKGGNE